MSIEISMSGVIDEGYFTARIVEDLVTEIIEQVTYSVVRQIDLRDLAAEFDTYDVAQYVCTSDVASNIDINSLADEVDHGEIAACFSVLNIARSIVGDMGEDLYQKVANAMSQNAPIMDQIVCRLRSQDDTIQTYDGVQESTDALTERVKVLEERLNSVLTLLEDVRFTFSCTQPLERIDRHPVM